jgi:hypothetical protein
MKRWRGLKDLVVDGVEHGSRAVERVHLGTAKRTFDILEAIPLVSAPSKVVHVIHDATTRASYATVRAVGRAVGAGQDLAFDAIEGAEPPPSRP